MGLKLNDKNLKGFIEENEYAEIAPLVKVAHSLIAEKSGAGSDFLGFAELPKTFDKAEFKEIKRTAEKIRTDSDVLIVIGIGGSYLGARSAIELLLSANYNLLKKSGLQIFFAGNNMSASYLNEILALCDGKRVSLNVISKSGTTTEPAIAFRIFRKYMEQRYGEAEAASRIYCTTDKARGALKKLCDAKGYKTFVVPDNIGGRYSVLTAVGLLPIAAAGIDIDQIMNGAFDAMKDFGTPDLQKNTAYRYATTRNILYSKGMNIELFVAYEPDFTCFNEFLKQLFGESEGKNKKGIFPSSMINSTDLHSMGQYVQDGRRCLFETVFHVKKAKSELIIPADEENADGMAYLNNRTLSFVNTKALEGTVLAHVDGGVPNIILEIPELTPYEYGYMVYFFEKACALSGYLLAVNPFNQPGVENYKNNMYALLGKPEFSELQKKLTERLNG